MDIQSFYNFADVTQSDFIVLIVKLMAYIIPFFLIPAAFRAGMGAFGAVTGMLSDRSRGFFDKQRKYRQGKYDYNKQRMRNGERFNNRGLNALTSRASTKNLGYGRRGKAAYQQKINNSGGEFGKSGQAAGIQHNDDALAALTYGSAIEAQRNLTKSVADGGFGFSEERAKQAVAAARSAGGFGRNRQVWAASQLAKTGTGYENLEQVSKTIARVSHGNAGQAAALAGDINSATKGVGRHDLAPGFSKLNDLALGEMGHVSKNGVAQGIDRVHTADSAAYHAATVAAARGVDPVTAVRQKPGAVERLADSLASHADWHAQRMNDASLSDAQRLESQNEYIDTVGQMEQLADARSYASAEVQEKIGAMLDNTTDLRTTTLDQVLGRTYDSSGQRTDTHEAPMLDKFGVQIMNPHTGAPATIRTTTPGSGVTQAQIASRERYERAKAPRPNPNDPNNNL